MRLDEPALSEHVYPMTDDSPAGYKPDELLKRRQETQKANKPPITVDKTISVSVPKTRPNTATKHYPRTAPKRVSAEKHDPRKVHFF